MSHHSWGIRTLDAAKFGSKSPEPKLGPTRPKFGAASRDEMPEV